MRISEFRKCQNTRRAAPIAFLFYRIWVSSCDANSPYYTVPLDVSNLRGAATDLLETVE